MPLAAQRDHKPDSASFQPASSRRELDAALASFPAVVVASVAPPAPSVADAHPPPGTPLPTVRDVRDALLRIAETVPLDGGAAEIARTWMASSPPFIVEGTWNSVLDAVAGGSPFSAATATVTTTAAGGAAGLGGASAAVSGGVGRALGLLSRLAGGGRTRAASSSGPSAASAAAGAPSQVRRDSGDGSGAVPITAAAASGGGSDAPDIRLETHVLTFEPGSAARGGGRTMSTEGSPSAAAASAAAAAAAAASAPVLMPLPGDSSATSASPLPLTACPLHAPLSLPLPVSNWGRHKATVSVRPLAAFPGDGAAFLSAAPQSLLLRRGEAGAIAVSMQLLRPGASIAALLLVDSCGAGAAAGATQLVLVRARAEAACFGVRLEDVPAVARHAGVAGIPLPLALLREALETPLPLPRALDTEGVFRVAPAADDVRDVRRALTDAAEAVRRGGAPATLDASVVARLRRAGAVAVAHAIKQWLRELPTPLLSGIPVEALLGAAGDAAYVAVAARYLPDGPRRVFAWLCDLLLAVAAREEENKMSFKALAICVAPNLCSSDAAANPMQALMVGQKSVALLTAVLAERRCSVAPAGPPPATAAPGAGGSSPA